MSLFDFFFPKYCVGCKAFGSYLCPNCFTQLSFDTQVICLVCGKGSIDGLTHPTCKKNDSIDGVFCAVWYRGIVKKLIFVLKYQPYLSDIKHTLVDLCYESLIQKELFPRDFLGNAVLVPIPLSQKRLKQRGYNQSLLLAKGLSKKLAIPVADLLVRTRNTKPQFGLSKEERKKIMIGAFALKSKHSKKYDIAFIVDDVLTTGTTLSEAAKVLKKAGFSQVWGITFARD